MRSNKQENSHPQKFSFVSTGMWWWSWGRNLLVWGTIVILIISRSLTCSSTTILPFSSARMSSGITWWARIRWSISVGCTWITVTASRFTFRGRIKLPIFIQSALVRIMKGIRKTGMVFIKNIKIVGRKVAIRDSALIYDLGYLICV